jgi:hypothetical protein
MASVTNITKSLADIRNDIYFLVNETSSVFPVTNVNEIINKGFNKVWDTTHKENEVIQYSTTTGVYDYKMPEADMSNGYAMVKYVYISNAVMESPVQLSPQEFIIEDTSTGVVYAEPTGYAVVNDTLFLYPTPDAVYTISVYYRRDFTPLTSDTDTVSLTDHEINAVIYFSCWMLKLKDEEIASAREFKSMFDETLGFLTLTETGLYRDGNIYGGAN